MLIKMARKTVKSFQKMMLTPIHQIRNKRILSQGYQKLVAPPPRPPITKALKQHRKKRRRSTAPPPRPPVTLALRRHREMIHRQQKRRAPPPPPPARKRRTGWTRL